MVGSEQRMNECMDGSEKRVEGANMVVFMAMVDSWPTMVGRKGHGEERSQRRHSGPRENSRTPLGPFYANKRNVQMFPFFLQASFSLVLDLTSGCSISHSLA